MCLWLKIELELGTEKKYVTWVVLNGVFSTKIKSQSDSIYQISAGLQMKFGSGSGTSTGTFIRIRSSM